MALPLLTHSQAWALLGLAILMEVAGTTSMRLAEGFTRLTPSVMIFVFYGISFGLNTMIIRTLGLSVVYGVCCADLLSPRPGFCFGRLLLRERGSGERGVERW